MTSHPKRPTTVTRSLLALGLLFLVTLLAIPDHAVAQANARTSGNSGASAATDVGPKNAGNSSGPGPDQILPTVVVTGTSIQSANSGAYQSAPVNVITSDAIQ